MLHGSFRISKLWQSPISPPFSFPHRLLIKFEFSSLFQAMRRSGTKISSVLSIGKSPYGRSLFASENIRSGDYILKVPYSVHIKPDNLLPKLKALLSDKIGIISKLAAVLLVEQKMDQDSGWAPCIHCLPRHGEIHSTVNVSSSFGFEAF
ncbi:uncharacterized protein LOC120187691 [Hibiscus syriacus]|uniref:uncharacterized protein LOC120187691 n=1 Tax=Hibiscus syriacus TaxID=106335 RepID=UPI00192147B8|nr:uncharacterized protein LOC120187691 [Hibiscus syriacus]